MIASYEKHEPVNTIQLPTKHKISKTTGKNTIPIPVNTQQFEIRPSMCFFDPNMASSPPNQFINSISQRMNMYYTDSTNIQYENKRVRANSFEYMISSLPIQRV